MNLDTYFDMYFTNLTPAFKYETCGFCHRVALPTYYVNYDKEEYALKYDDGFMCYDPDCIDKICMQFFGQPHSEAIKKYEHIGANTSFLAKKYKQSEEYICNYVKHDPTYSPPVSARTSLAGYIARCGELDGPIKYKERCTKIARSMTIDWFIERYGIREGSKRYEARMKAGIDAASNITRSKHQFELFDELHDIDDRWEAERYAGGVGIADMFNKPLKVVIEYFGNYWHCHPECYADDYYNKSLKMTAAKKREIDRNRISRMLASKSIDTVIVVWEKTFVNDGLTSIVDRC